MLIAWRPFFIEKSMLYEFFYKIIKQKHIYNKEKIMIISFSGPSGIGKGFIKKRLVQVYPYIEELKWLTTRPLRLNEKYGNRIHVSLPRFNKLLELDKLTLVQDLYGHRYGLRKKDLLPSPCLKLTELHSDNLEVALKINPAIITIGFITFDIPLLYERLSVLRNTESAMEIEQRIIAAEIETETILRLKSLFTIVIEVTKNSETLVFDQVVTTLAPHLTKKK